MQLYGLNTAVVPVRERWWVAPLVLLLPLALAALTALPALLLQAPHPLTVLPGLPLCLAPSYSPVSASSCCQLLLGLLLPAALTLVLVWCLALRRCCNTCQVHTAAIHLQYLHIYISMLQADTCIHSFCKEEMALSLVTVPHLLALLAIHLPQLSALATRLGLAPALPTPWLPPELGSALELGLGLVLPLVVYTTLPTYSKFRQAPDDSDVKNEIHRRADSQHQQHGDHD